MDVQTPFVVHEGCISLLMGCDPITDLLAQSEVVCRGAVKLIGEGTKEAVPVAEGGGGVEPHGSQLVVK